MPRVAPTSTDSMSWLSGPLHAVIPRKTQQCIQTWVGWIQSSNPAEAAGGLTFLLSLPRTSAFSICHPTTPRIRCLTRGKTTPLQRHQKDKLVMNVHIHWLLWWRTPDTGLRSITSHFPSPCNESVRKKRRHIFQDYFKWVSLLSWAFKSKSSKGFHLSLESSASEIAPKPISYGAMIGPLLQRPPSHTQALTVKVISSLPSHLFLFPALLLAFHLKSIRSVSNNLPYKHRKALSSLGSKSYIPFAKNPFHTLKATSSPLSDLIPTWATVLLYP